MTEDEPTRFSKEWVRENWDYERDTATKSVLIVKSLHEFHIILPGIIGALIFSGIFWTYDASELQVIVAGATGFSGGVKLFFDKWWCSTLSVGHVD